MRLHPRLCGFLVLTTLLIAAGCASDSRLKQVRTYGMGERIDMGKFVYNVFDTQWLTHIGEGPSARVPEQRFFLVRLSITNSGGAEATVPTLTILADSGQTYTELTNGEGVPQWTGFLKRIKPAETLQGNVVFDAPPAHYKLRIADESEQRAGLVDIPLTFGSETPEIPTPGRK